ncbi:hypothetical protein SAMN05216386_1694 [Nitrosospira briensis]|uniref:Uncharacterized protein n=1 Tax=Nitrosospira briensis TaxID=35799 RepID=A0A1I5BJD5_9PROT|nr:hypothetical protein SAMN05216386_1694 [Nitrosospira briensis]
MRNYRNSGQGTFTSTVKTTADHGDIQQEVDVTQGLRKRILCPSASAEVKSVLLGVVQPNGSVGFIKDRIEVTREFLDIATRGGGLPETRFRFSSPCLGSACKQWANGGCSLPERLADLISRSDATDAPLPECSIRDQCRWFDQRGSDACRICPKVITRDNSQ